MSAKHDRDLTGDANKQPCCGVAVFVEEVDQWEPRADKPPLTEQPARPGRGAGWIICGKQPAVDFGELHLVKFPDDEKWGAKGEQLCRYICATHKDQGADLGPRPTGVKV